MTVSKDPAWISELAKDDRGLELLVVSWVFTALATGIVGLKIFTRAHILHALGWDDFFIFLSTALVVACSAIFSYDVYLGMGKHAVNISPDLLNLTIKVNFIANPFGIMAFSLPNISVAILLVRLLAPHAFRAWALYALAISQVVIAGVSCVLLFAQCTPVEFLWNSAVKATCFKPGAMTGYSYFVGAYTAATDVVFGVIPIVAFWKLHLRLGTKIGLCLMMSCTLFAAICAIIKTSYIHTLADLSDFTYSTVDLVIWAIVEANVIIIAACVPTLRPFFHKAFKQHLSSSPASGKLVLANHHHRPQSHVDFATIPFSSLPPTILAPEPSPLSWPRRPQRRSWLFCTGKDGGGGVGAAGSSVESILVDGGAVRKHAIVQTTELDQRSFRASPEEVV